MRETRISEQGVLVILLGCVAYQALLCFANTHFLKVSPALVGVAELMIVAATLPFLARPLRPHAIVVLAIIAANFLLLALITQRVDYKAFRDLAIPVIFLWLGWNAASPATADGLLKRCVLLVLAVGLFELFFVEQYTRIFDVLSYYVNLGSIDDTAAGYTTHRLQLNAFRPDAIGRTVFPELLGTHRVSSIFLEPISLGNFAVIVAAWGLAKERVEFRTALFFLASALLLVALSDSRFGLGAIVILALMRCTLVGNANTLIAAASPFISLGALFLIGAYIPSTEDSVLGRLTWTANTLHRLDTWSLLGVNKSVFSYSDMGFAYIFSRFGVVLCLVIWVAYFLVPQGDPRAVRFRAFAAVYISLILAVSGTSLFALKTAGILWFLVGCVAASPRLGGVAAEDAPTGWRHSGPDPEAPRPAAM